VDSNQLSPLVSHIVAVPLYITCKCGSSKHRVLKTTMLSNGNVRFAGTCQTETPQRVNKKFRTVDNSVRLPHVPTMVGMRWLGAMEKVKNNSFNQANAV
jgi:hypothetical protein